MEHLGDSRAYRSWRTWIGLQKIRKTLGPKKNYSDDRTPGKEWTSKDRTEVLRGAFWDSKKVQLQ